MVIPEGMDAPDRQMALRVPDQQATPGSTGANADGCVAEPPAFYVDSGEPNPENLPVRPSSLPGAADAPRPAPARVARQVTRFIEDWAEAWGRRDFNAWVRFYEPDFVPEGYADNAAWRSEQERLFEVEATTRIERASVRVSTLPEDKVRARFDQKFGLGTQERLVKKELVLVPGPRGRGWLISEDYVLDVR